MIKHQLINEAMENYRNFFWNDPESNCGEPDYLRSSDGHIAEIYINTLSNEECKEFNNCAFSILDGEDLIISPTYIIQEDVIGPLEFDCYIERRVNREQRRHGAFGKDGYKRPRKNKKLYEY